MQVKIKIEAIAREATEVDEGIWSRGIMADDKKWYNAEASTVEEVDKFFKDGTFARGKTVTLEVEKGKKGPIIVGVIGHPEMPKPEQRAADPEQKKPEFLIDLVKATLMPKIHVGLTQEFITEKIDCGTYVKVLTKSVTVNLSVNSESVTPKGIKDLMDMAEAEIKSRIAEVKK
jgi:hypothetical protein